MKLRQGEQCYDLWLEFGQGSKGQRLAATREVEDMSKFHSSRRKGLFQQMGYSEPAEAV